MNGWEFLDRHINAILGAACFVVLVIALARLAQARDAAAADPAQAEGPSGPAQRPVGGPARAEPTTPPPGTSGVSLRPGGGR